MSTPVIWIIFPIICATLLFLFRRWQGLVTIIGFTITLLLAFFALKLPIGEANPIQIVPGLATIRLNESMTVLGRSFILDDSSRLVVFLIYLSNAFWFGGAWVIRPTHVFVPVGLGMAAIFTAALSVNPFLYAALFILTAVMLSVAMLSPVGQRVNPGIYRYIIFQTLGMPFILYAGWTLSGVEAKPAQSELVWLALFFLGLGLAFLIGVFPFHTWIPMLSEETHPYIAAYILFSLPMVISLFIFKFLQNLTWLRDTPGVYIAMLFVGGVMVLIGGVWAAFQRHLGRIMGFAATIEIGLSILALGLIIPVEPISTQGVVQRPNIDIDSLEIFFLQIIPRALGLAIWAFGLWVIRSKTDSLSFEAIQGQARRLPIASISIVLANLSIAGLPLLAAFPARVALWSELASQSLLITTLVLIGSAGLLIAGVRTLTTLSATPEGAFWQVSERKGEIVLLVVGWILLIFVGLFI